MKYKSNDLLFYMSSYLNNLYNNRGLGFGLTFGLTFSLKWFIVISCILLVGYCTSGENNINNLRDNNLRNNNLRDMNIKNNLKDNDIINIKQKQRAELIDMAMAHERDAMAKEDEFMAAHLRSEGYRVEKVTK